MKNSKEAIGREGSEGSRGYRDDFLGHDFGDGYSVGPHVNVWGPGIEDLQNSRNIRKWISCVMRYWRRMKNSGRFYSPMPFQVPGEWGGGFVGW